MHQVEVPIYFNEPLSVLQRIAAMFEYTDLLVQAYNADESSKRISLIACFVVTQFCYLDLAFNKPFNPLLGETYTL
jgi:hypothetical protein